MNKSKHLNKLVRLVFSQNYADGISARERLTTMFGLSESQITELVINRIVSTRECNSIYKLVLSNSWGCGRPFVNSDGKIVVNVFGRETALFNY